MPGHQTVFISVHNADVAYKRAVQDKLSIYKPLTKEKWGIEFSVLDPDGNKVEYLQKLEGV